MAANNLIDAQLSNWVYGGPGGYDPNNPDSGLPSGYTILQAYSDPNSNYLGVLVGQLDADGNVVSGILVSRGTQFDHLTSDPGATFKDLSTDAQIVLGQSDISAADFAIGAERDAIATLQSLGLDSIQLTGQSLGGGIAQLQAFDAQTNMGFSAQFDTFASIGMGGVFQSRYGLSADEIASLSSLGTNHVFSSDPFVGPVSSLAGQGQIGQNKIGVRVDFLAAGR